MIAARRRLAEARVALMLMTRLPAGRIAGAVPDLSAARWAYPLAGLPAGIVVWAALAAALGAGLPPTAAGFAALGAAALVTGGLHLDGLADFADGIGGGRDRAHCLEIMRDSRIGSYGVLALLVAAGTGAASLGAAAPGVAALLLVAVASRLLMLLALDILPPARPEGLGRAASGTGAAWLPGAAALLVLWAFAGVAAGLALAVMALVALPVGLIARRRLGGQTGDVLGAVQAGSETAGWATLAAIA